MGKSSVTMATCLEQCIMETDLMMNHNDLVKRLESKYADYIRKILKQKRMILHNLQKQFNERRDKIRQTFSNQNIVTNDPVIQQMISLNNIKKEEPDYSTIPRIQLSKNNNASLEQSHQEQNELNASIISKKESKQVSKKKTVKTLKRPKMKSKENKDKKYKCPHCDYASNKSYSVKRHIPIHFKPKKVPKPRKIHKCPHCEYSSKNLWNVKAHIRTHTGEKPFACNYGECRKRFSTKGSLDQHIKRHKGIKDHKCSYKGCDMAFVTNHDLQEHLRRHRGEKPWQCRHCKMRFGSNTHWNRHIRTQHNGIK